MGVVTSTIQNAANLCALPFQGTHISERLE